MKVAVKSAKEQSFIVTYSDFRIIGHGSFGAVFLATQKIESPASEDTMGEKKHHKDSGHPVPSTTVAIKMVYQDQRYKVSNKCATIIIISSASVITL